MDEEELFAQVFVFFFAGHETSSVSLTWILHFLAQYPDVQQKLRREVKRVIKRTRRNMGNLRVNEVPNSRDKRVNASSTCSYLQHIS